jgi:hypothetical protein
MRVILIGFYFESLTLIIPIDIEIQNSLSNFLFELLLLVVVGQIVGAGIEVAGVNPLAVIIKDYNEVNEPDGIS